MSKRHFIAMMNAMQIVCASKKRHWVFAKCLISTLLCFLITGCHPNSHLVEPNITYFTPQSLINALPSAFEPLTPEEQLTDWGKELRLGQFFAHDVDFYRALTCFKSALFLLPSDNFKRRIELEYQILQCYYFAGKYAETIDAFESSLLLEAPPDFPAFHDLVIMLYDAYLKTNQPEKAYRILCLIAKSDEETAKDLALEASICYAEFDALNQMSETYRQKDSLCSFLEGYRVNAKSVSKAQTLNALLPGAGYYYVGQKKSALTSFAINALFTAAAYQFFDRGYIAAGLITLSFEMGWYLGGINGAGLAAKEYNQSLYECRGKEFLFSQRLFPVLMFQKSF